jgi:hypothetical protein
LIWGGQILPQWTWKCQQRKGHMQHHDHLMLSVEQ